MRKPNEIPKKHQVNMEDTRKLWQSGEAMMGKMTIEQLLQEYGAHIELGERALFWRNDLQEWRVWEANLQGDYCTSLYQGANLQDAISYFLHQQQ